MDRNLTILVAEDSRDDAFFFERAIRKVGLTNPVQIVTDGTAALCYLKGEGVYQNRREFPFPSVLFMDVHLPQVDGFGVLRWLRDHPQCAIVPILVFSSSQDPKDVVRAYQLGASAYFVKPSSTGELAEILRSAVDFWARCAKPPVDPLLHC
jgi:CheY-like chemotaxis protein